MCASKKGYTPMICIYDFHMDGVLQFGTIGHFWIVEGGSNSQYLYVDVIILWHHLNSPRHLKLLTNFMGTEFEPIHYFFLVVHPFPLSPGL